METESTFFQQYKYHLLAGGILLATVTGLVIWQVRKKNKKKEQSRTSYPETSSSPAPKRDFCQSRNYPLGFGNCHPDVIILQKGLKVLGADLGKFGPGKDGVDGKFGNKTLAALRAKFGKETVTRADMDQVKAVIKQYGGI